MPFLKKLIPDRLLKFIRPAYHGAMALIASLYYGRPSGQLVVIGVTGTAGKSTTAAMLSYILNFSGQKCGYMTTVNFFDGKEDFINKHGLSMPGGPRLQKQLKEILDNGCRFAVVECTSEGLAQNRHLGIKFTAALFTNLSQAHIQAHGSFENYKKAKGKLFKSVKLIGVNLDDAGAEYFLSYPAQKKFGVSFENRISSLAAKAYYASKTENGFDLEDKKFEVKLPGEFNKYNALLAAAAANMLGVDLNLASQALSSFSGIRGRMEGVPNEKGLNIFVDYGCEPATIRAALKAAAALPHQRLIHVFGTTGGHRDVSKRFDFGRASAELANISILTNDDVYDSDPQEILDNMQVGFDSIPENQRKARQVLQIPDRRSAIQQALKIAQAGDTILITGKGSEQFLVLPKNIRIQYDEVSEVKKLLAAL